MDKFDYVELKFPAKPQYVSVIRLMVSGLANRIGFSYNEIEDTKIAVSEAVTNVVHHAYGDAEVGEIAIGCALYKEKLEIMVANSGNGFNFEEIKRTTGPYAENDNMALLREGGLGLFLMETLMDEVRVKNEAAGVTVFMTKYVAREQVKRNVERVHS